MNRQAYVLRSDYHWINVVVSVFAILRLMVSVSEIDKGSEYGTKKTKTT